MSVVPTELDSGEGNVSAKVPNVRSVAPGFRIGVGSRGARDDRAGRPAPKRAPALQGLGVPTARQEIAETFDAVSAERNAATSRGHNVVRAVTIRTS